MKISDLNTNNTELLESNGPINVGFVGGVDRLSDNEVTSALNTLPDQVLERFQFSFPLMSNSGSTWSNESRGAMVDEDGFPISEGRGFRDFRALQKECWLKFEENPQISSHVRDFMGHMTGWGFGFFSPSDEVQTHIDSTMEDVRNNLYEVFPKLVGRSEVQGELFLMATAHEDGFIEIDFLDPKRIDGGGDDQSGIIFHPLKQTFPLLYLVRFDVNQRKTGWKRRNFPQNHLIPSINLAYFPSLIGEIKNHPDFNEKKLKIAQVGSKFKKKYEKLGGFYRFIIPWDRGFLTKRNTPHIKSTIRWINYYEDLKRYEIDHKKAAASYLYTIEVENIKYFRFWLNLSEAERKTTGLMEQKTAGGTIMLPPGMKMEIQSPKLPNISDSDTDIMAMVSSGLQKPQDTMMGDYRSSYASVKAAQGPQSDRTNDELSYFWRFLIYSFWRGIFHLKKSVNVMKDYYTVRETVGYDDKKKPVMKNVKKEPHKIVNVCLPISKFEDIESTAKALLGTKHASLVDVLNIPREEIANRLGFYNYQKLVRQKSTEDEMMPETLSVSDQEAAQEKSQTEPPIKKKTSGKEE